MPPVRAWTNYAIFAAIAGTIGWAGIALDQATGAARGNSLGWGYGSLTPAVAALLLYRFRPDGGGPLGLTLRFPARGRWFALAALLYLPLTAIIVLAGITAGVGSFQASGPAGTPGCLPPWWRRCRRCCSRTPSRS